MEGAIIAGVDPSRRAHEEKGRLCQMTQVVPCNRKMIHARGYDCYPQMPTRSGPIVLQDRRIRCVVTGDGTTCWHAVGLSYLSAASPELGSTLQT
jgi:hypothetical protein